MKRILIVAIAAALVALGPTALADQINLGGSSTSITFCAPSGGGNISVAGSFGANCTSPVAGALNGPNLGDATFQHGGTNTQGTYSISFPVPPLVLIGPPNSFGQFGVNSVQSAFSASFGALGTLIGNITYNFVVDNTANPRFDGNLLVTGTGTGALGADFPVGSTAHIDFTMNALTGSQTTLDLLFQNGGTDTASLSSGQVPAVPDGGATVMLLGGALVGLATLRRRLGI
jgi:hypothetical protein